MTSKVLDKLIRFRFELFLASEIAILFDAMVIPYELFDRISSGLFFYLNLIAGGLLLVSKKRYHIWFVVLFLLLTGLIYGSALVEHFDKENEPILTNWPISRFLHFGNIRNYHSALESKNY